MRFVRTLLAILIAWSVAMAPTFGVAAGFPPSGAPSSHHSVGHDHQSAASGHAHHHQQQLGVGGRCCDDEEHVPDHGLPGDCGTMPGCALKSLTLAPSLAANLAAPITVSTLLIWHPTRVIPPESPAPPLRPPRS